jgi:hypothetical protein
MGILLHRFWLPHHDTAPREKKDVVALALTNNHIQPNKLFKRDRANGAQPLNQAVNL